MAEKMPPEDGISAEFPFVLHRASVLGSEMAYVDTGHSAKRGSPGQPTVVFLHGNPTSSYLYRNIIPHVSPGCRCVAPDLIGMGASEKPAHRYGFQEHARYLCAFFEAVIPSGPVILVVHDWGSALGFDWAYHHQNRVAGLAFMEFIRPFLTWDDMVAAGETQDIFRLFRNESTGRKMIIEANIFIEVVLRAAIVRNLSAVELDHYRQPFLDPGSREPMFRWPNEIPIEGSPPDVHEVVSRYHEWLLRTELPKLFFWASPGRIVDEDKARWYIQALKNTTSVYLGQGLHFLQEDHPNRIGSEISRWLAFLEL